MAAHSPASSPRLPSPPPIAEDQVGPTSPGVSAFAFEDHGKFPLSTLDTGSSRRIRPGTKAEDMAEGPPLVELQEIDSAFQLTEHLKALHYNYTQPPDSHSTAPITAAIARQLAQPPPNISQEIWLYELGRFLIQKTNAIIVALFADSPPCSAQTCPEMRASEWQYLCAVHDPPKSCSAIDYCCHTLDWAATTLTSSKIFPSRLGLGSGNVAGAGDKVLQQQMREITNIFRRVYRIYAHAWFQHRDMFWRVEGRTGLYVLFKTVCDEYGMIQAENYTIPPEAEGLEPETRDDADIREAPSVLKRDESAGEEPTEPEAEDQPDSDSNHIPAPTAGETTKRHRHTASDRTPLVTTVIQEEAEEEEDPSDKGSMERTPTSLQDNEGPLQIHSDKSSAEEEAADGERAIPHVLRKDTLKPPKSPELAEDEGETTVVERTASSDDVPESEPEPQKENEVVAAEGEHVEKTVAD